jgi:hypothetical protein
LQKIDVAGDGARFVAVTRREFYVVPAFERCDVGFGEPDGAN